MSKNREKELVSVIIPVYNAEKYIRSCITSVLRQSYLFFELLLIDDGSTDDSGNICEEYAKRDKRVQVIHRENQGVSATRNLGIEKANGRFLVFVDADDQIHKDLLKIYMQAYTSNQVLLCGISNDLMDLEKEYTKEDIENKSILWKKENFMELFAKDYVNSPWNKLYDANIIQKNHIRYPQNLSLGEDLLFNLTYFQYAPVEYKLITLPLYYYQDDHTDSLSNSFRLDLFEIQLTLFGRLEQFLKAEDIWKEKNQTTYYRIYWDRLYLTTQIYQKRIKEYHEPEVIKKVTRMLSHKIWREVEQKCREYSLMNWKRRLKKSHLYFLKKFYKDY